MKVLDGIGYIVVQLAGSYTAVSLVKQFTSENLISASGPSMNDSNRYFANIMNELSEKTGEVATGAQGALNMSGILLEALFTCGLVMVIFGTLVDKRSTMTKCGGLFVGLFVMAGIMAIGPMTGAAMNPARWFGAAVQSGTLGDQWQVYILGPILGGLVGGLVYQYIFMDRDQWPALEDKAEAAS